MLEQLQEIRCYVPYDGWCGYRALAKSINMEVSEVLELLLNWSTNAELMCPAGNVSDVNFSFINGSAQRAEVRIRAQSCLDVLNQHRDNVSIGEALYCTRLEIIIVLQLKKLRGLVLCDVKPEFGALTLAVDYLVTNDAVKEVTGIDALQHLKRDDDYDALIIMEHLHWVYALPKLNANAAPHTRLINGEQDCWNAAMVSWIGVAFCARSHYFNSACWSLYYPHRLAGC
jgi:hypothetical protein